jgi:putative SOS response-associated peptidase YedK
MCGRYTLITAPDVLVQQFGLEELPLLSPRYNIAPTQQVTAVRRPTEGARRELVFLRWGLIPSWAEDATIGNRLLNARADTVADKPSFRSAFRSRRCLVLADGFFEWQTAEGRKQPFYFRSRGGEAFAIAGLWERWSRGGKAVESCTLITTEANALVLPTHDRMPAILSRDDYEGWLDPAVQDAERLQSLLRSYPPEQMTAWPVSGRVNSPRHDDPACVEPVSIPPRVVQRNLFEHA